MNNQPGALFDVRADRGVSSNGGTNVINNAGTFRKSTTSGTSAIGVPFNNTGSVQVQTGRLELNNGGTGNGAFTVSATTTLDLGGGTHTLQAEVVNPAGNALIASAAVTFHMHAPSAQAPAGPDIYDPVYPGQPYPPVYPPVYPPQPYPPQGRPKPVPLPR